MLLFTNTYGSFELSVGQLIRLSTDYFPEYQGLYEVLSIETFGGEQYPFVNLGSEVSAVSVEIICEVV